MKKTLLWFILALCLVWVGMASYYLLNTENNTFNPRVLFAEKGALVTIIHRPNEVNLEDLFPQISSGMHSEINTILSFTEKKSARIYFSSFRDFCLIESPSIWTKKDITNLSRILGSTPIKEGVSTWKLNSKFWCLSNANKLIVYKTLPVSGIASNSKCWNLWDKNASYSLLSPTVDKVENIYGNRSERYISQAKSNKALTLIDDYELFASSLPESISTYQFYQTDVFPNYAKTEQEFDFAKTILSGAVFFNYNNSLCLLFDPATGFAPFDLYENKYVDGRNDLVKFETTPYVLPTFGFDKTENFGIKVGSNYIICGDLKTAENIQSSYKLGQTFALKESELKEGFFQLPKKVSYRTISKQGFETLSYLNGLIHATTLRTISLEEEIKGDLINEKGEVLATLRGDIQNFYAMHNSKGLPFYLIQTTNQATQFIDANTNKQLNDLKLVQQSVPTRIVLDDKSFWNLHSDLSFNLIGVDGNARAGYPLDLPKTASSNVVISKENGANFYLFGTPNGTIEKYSSNWKLIKSYVISSLPVKSIQLSENRNVLINLNNQEWYVGALNMNAKGKSYPMAIKSVLEVTDPTETGKYFISDNGIYYVSPSQEPKLLKSGSGFRMHQIFSENKQSTILYSAGNQLFALDQNGKNVFNFKTTLSTIESAYFTKIDGKRCVAVLDGIQNNIYLHNEKGLLLKEQNWEGSKFVHLQTIQNQLTMLTFVGRYLIKYTIKSI